MRGRTNIGSGGVALNATEVNKIIAPNNNIVAGDFVQYYTIPNTITLPYNASGRTIKKLDANHYIMTGNNYLFLIKKNGNSFSVIQTVNIAAQIYSICVDIEDSSILYVLEWGGNPQTMFMETYKYSGDEITLMATSQCDSNSSALENQIFCLGTLGSYNSVLCTVGYKSGSNKYYAEIRVYKRTTNNINDYSYVLWKYTSIDVTTGTNIHFPSTYHGGVIKNGNNDFYINGLCQDWTGTQNIDLVIARFHIDLSDGTVVVDQSKDLISYASSYRPSYLYILNDKLIWAYLDGNRTTHITLTRMDTLVSSSIVEFNTTNDIYEIFELNNNKFAIDRYIYLVNSDTYEVTQIYQSGSSDIRIRNISIITDDGYILSGQGVGQKDIKILQLINNKSEFYDTLDIDYVKQWTSSGATAGQPIGVAKDSGSTGDTIGVYVPVSS